MVDPVSVTAWIGAVTALANMIKAYRDLIRASADRRPSPEERRIIKEAGETVTAEGAEVPDLIVGREELEANVRDIDNARVRFVEAINDETKTPKEIDEEQEVAKRSICVHLERIRELNAGELPRTIQLRDSKVELRNLWLSWCRNFERERETL